ncbi:MAG TPA: Wzz/FepE/Etk N-terminal domain-containing protein [Actinomycetota bacterium]|nr:Wzz/FepE/Etk N-terminal domain-containing protein [Actinomycetota bacterium]
MRSPSPKETRHLTNGHKTPAASEAPGRPSPGREPARLAVPEEVQPAPDRWTLLWRAKVWIALATVLAGAGAYATSSRITPSYQASSLVEVSAHPQTGISPQDIATASNELAAQLAQLTRTAPVVDLAAQSLHEPAGAVGQHVVAAVLANQNLIQITAQDTTPKRTQARATAMAQALQGYVSARGASAAGTPPPAPTNPQLAAIDAQLAAAQEDAAKAQAAAASSYPGSVSIALAAQKASFVQQLQIQRNTVAMQVQATDASANPSVQVLGDASAAVKIQPRPTLYAAVTLVITALLASQLSIFVGSRRQLKRRATSHRGQ